MRRAWAVLPLLAPWLGAQQGVGRLYYTTPSGRAVALRVLAAGPGGLALADEPGDAGRLRAFVAAHAGPLAARAPGAIPLGDPIPPGWDAGQPGRLVRHAGITYWVHAPGQVVPAAFRTLGQDWRLVAAHLPRAARP